MKTKREAPTRGSGNRRRGRDAAGSGIKRVSPDSMPRRRTSTTPVRESANTKAGRSGPQTSPITRPADRPARAKSTSQAKARAKARKAKAPRVVRPKLTERLALRLASIDLRPRTLASKVPFVVLIIGSLAVGLGLTLWLSTASAERSYQLGDARERTRMLQQQKESLERDVREAESAPELAEEARRLGMIPTRDTAHLVQDPTGNWVVVGDPKPADGVPPPPLNSKLPEELPTPSGKPVATPPEVSVRLGQGPVDPQAPVRSGPQLLVRAPDGSTTLGAAQVPSAPGGLLPGQLPPGALVPVPGQVLAPLPGQVQPAIPPQVPALGAPVMPPLFLHEPMPAAPPPAPVPAPPLVPPPALAPVPLPAQAPAPMPAPPPAPVNVEQFAPIAPTTPGAAR